MKLIAKTNFRNTKLLGIRPLDEKGKPDVRHKEHVHKGARFDFGSGENFVDLSAPEQKTVLLLAYAGCIPRLQWEPSGDANQPPRSKPYTAEVIDKIDAEAEADEADRAKAKNSAVAAGSAVDVIKQLIASGVLVVAKPPEPDK